MQQVAIGRNVQREKRAGQWVMPPFEDLPFKDVPATECEFDPDHMYSECLTPEWHGRNHARVGRGRTLLRSSVNSGTPSSRGRSVSC
jgi:hypothetical protein